MSVRQSGSSQANRIRAIRVIASAGLPVSELDYCVEKKFPPQSGSASALF